MHDISSARNGPGNIQPWCCRQIECAKTDILPQVWHSTNGYPVLHTTFKKPRSFQALSKTSRYDRKKRRAGYWT